MLDFFTQDFIGNDDQNGTVQHWFLKPFIGRYVRVTPIEWHGKGCLRLEIYGCDGMLITKMVFLGNYHYIMGERTQGVDSLISYIEKSCQTV